MKKIQKLMAVCAISFASASLVNNDKQILLVCNVLFDICFFIF